MHRANSALCMASPKKIATLLINGSNRRNVCRMYSTKCFNIKLLLYFQIVPVLSSRPYNSAASEPFLNGTTSNYVEEMYNNWLRDPASVHTVGFVWNTFLNSIHTLTFETIILVLGCLLPQQHLLSATQSSTRNA